MRTFPSIITCMSIILPMNSSLADSAQYDRPTRCRYKKHYPRLIIQKSMKGRMLASPKLLLKKSECTWKFLTHLLVALQCSKCMYFSVRQTKHTSSKGVSSSSVPGASISQQIFVTTFSLLAKLTFARIPGFKTRPHARQVISSPNPPSMKSRTWCDNKVSIKDTSLVCNVSSCRIVRTNIMLIIRP